MSNTKRYILLILISLASFNLNASPLIKIGDAVDIYFTGRTGMVYVSNIFMNSSNKVDDFIYVVEPGFEMVFGRQSIWGLNIKFYESMEFYFDRSELNNYGEHIELDGYYDSGGITEIRFDAAYHTTLTNSGTENVVGALIRRRNYELGLGANFEVSGRSTIDAAIDIIYSDYRTYINLFGDSLTIAAPISYMYEVVPTMEIGVGYRYRYTDFERMSTGFKAPDRSDHYVHFLLNGDIGPRLSSDTTIGFQLRHLNGVDSSSDISADTVFTWEATQKLQLKVGASRDYRSTGEGNSVSDTRGFFDVAYNMTNKLRLDVMTSITYVDYEALSRKDEFVSAGGQFTYQFSSYFSAELGYMYTNNHSTYDGINLLSSGGLEPNASFNHHVLQISASVKY